MIFLKALISFFVGPLVRLRYKVQVKGLDALKHHPFDPARGIVFLPNHPAEIDPVILEMLLFKRFKPRPLVVEHFYQLKGWRLFMDAVSALPLPTLDEKANKWRIKRFAAQLNQMVRALKAGENFLFYPAGRLKISSAEVLGGASLTHQLLQACPDLQIVLVRTTGLWGSQFSRALTGRSPAFGEVMRSACKILLKNGIFFAPKREVLVEFEVAPSDFPYSGSRLEVNHYLEQWYNRSPDPLKLVSFCCWKQELPEIAAGKRVARTEQREVSPTVLQEVNQFLSTLSKRPAPERTERLSEELGLDSLDVVQIYLFLDEKYGVHNLEPVSLLTVEDVLQAASNKGKEATSAAEAPLPAFKWPTHALPLMIQGDTIQEAFLRSAQRGGSALACVDALSGSMTYDQLKLRALILSEKIRALPGARVGILLPSSVAAYLVILAVQLAGKTPVMLNWTVGVKALDHALELTGFERVITSMKFLDQLANEDLGKIEELFVFLEEIRGTISWKDKLRALRLSLKSVKGLMATLHLTPSDPAVILFTSGTEALPKAVPLSHANLLSNQRAGLAASSACAEDIIYGVLPPFHSFGFSITGLLPLLAGLRVCYAPDPTNTHGLARDIERYQPTLFCCAPSFIRALFRVATPQQLSSLRWIVSGAEKTPQELFEYVQKYLPRARLLEGYGITECSPIVSIDRADEPHRGVGKPVSGVELLIVDPETQQPLSPGQEGEICIAGPGVFNGYLGQAKSPFVHLHSKRWYLSGDRGSLTPEGHLLLSGRSKRFVKIGGEMVGLSGLEETILEWARQHHLIPEGQEGPPLALSVRGKETDKPSLILFTTFPLEVEAVNRGLKQGGFGRIAKIAQVCQIKEIPLMGTGKTHYRFLDEIPC